MCRTGLQNGGQVHCRTGSSSLTEGQKVNLTPFLADLSKVTLRQLHEALGEPALFAMGNRTEHPDCRVEQAVNAALDSAFDDAEALLMQRFESVTLAELVADFGRHHATHRAGVPNCP